MAVMGKIRPQRCDILTPGWPARIPSPAVGQAKVLPGGCWDGARAPLPGSKIPDGAGLGVKGKGRSLLTALFGAWPPELEDDGLRINSHSPCLKSRGKDPPLLHPFPNSCTPPSDL
jgi:hypothetical protein